MNPLKSLLKIRRKLLPSSTLNAGASEEAAFDRVKVGLMLITIVALSFMMSVHLRQDRLRLRLNEISPRDIHAPRSMVYPDTERTEAQRDEAIHNVAPIYDVDALAHGKARGTVTDLFGLLANYRTTTQHIVTRPNSVHNAARISSRLNLEANATNQALLSLQAATKLTTSEIRRLLILPPVAYQNLTTTALKLADEFMDREIRDNGEDLARIRKEVPQRAEQLISPDDASIVATIVNQALTPNRIYNSTKTTIARSNAAGTVQPVYGRLLPGEKIISAGEVVRQDTLDKLTALGLIDPRMRVTTGIAICILAAVMVLVVAYYIAHRLPALYRDTRRLALLATIVLMSVAGIKVGSWMLGLQFSGGQLGYLGMMSVTAASMLVCVLLDVHLAILITALLSIQSGIIMNHEIRFSVMTLISSLVGIGCVTNVRFKNNMLITITALGLSNVGLLWLMGFLFNDQFSELLSGSVWAVVVAISTTFLYWFGGLALERPFGILTYTTKLEMSAFDRPLLRQLCAVAPGTYAHSMMVGTLAEAGAQAVGADGLLCRVGGYYHDIGKMNRPDFFIENQRNDNVHARLSPSLSALIITAHVRDGIEMAKQHRLPAEIRDIIAQHHGTTLISYFYHQALADNVGGDCVPPGLEERFRYPGPKPQTREAAIVMLADSIEAAARCIDKPNREKLEALIANIIRGKIEDGQLDQCPLTFADVKKITDAFLHVLRAMMHGRIDYPKELPRSNANIGDISSNESRSLTPAEASSRIIDENTSLFERERAPDDVHPSLGLSVLNSELMALMNSSVDDRRVSLMGDPSNDLVTQNRLTQNLVNDNSTALTGTGLRVVPLTPNETILPTEVTTSELIYGHPLAERSDAPGKNYPSKTGSASFAGVGRPRPRGGKRSTDR